MDIIIFDSNISSRLQIDNTVRNDVLRRYHNDTLVIANPIAILNLNESNSMRVLYATYGYFSIGVIIFITVLLVYLSRIERINTYRK